MLIHLKLDYTLIHSKLVSWIFGERCFADLKIKHVGIKPHHELHFGLVNNNRPHVFFYIAAHPIVSQFLYITMGIKENVTSLRTTSAVFPNNMCHLRNGRTLDRHVEHMCVLSCKQLLIFVL